MVDVGDEVTLLVAVDDDVCDVVGELEVVSVEVCVDVPEVVVEALVVTLVLVVTVVVTEELNSHPSNAPARLAST